MQVKTVVELVQDLTGGAADIATGLDINNPSIESIKRLEDRINAIRLLIAVYL